MMGPITKKKIVLVGRENGETGELKEVLSNWGMTYILQPLDDELIEALLSSHPDIIIFRTGILNGGIKEIWKNIRRTNGISHIPIIAVVPDQTIYKVEDSVGNITLVEEPVKEELLKKALNSILSMDVAIKFWGVRGSTPCANNENMVYGGNTTCVQVEIPDADEILILDSGTGIRNLGNHLLNLYDTVKGRIFITHPHWDHIQGFPFFKPIYYSNNHFEIHMPPQVNGGCREILSGHLTKTFFPVTIEMIDANIQYISQTKERQEYDKYEIEYMLANHPINTAIYKIYINGLSIVFSPDNELGPGGREDDPDFYDRLSKFIDGVDVLIHDAQYDRDSYRERVGWGHSAWEEVVDFASRARVKNLFLTHHDPDSNDNELNELDAQIQKEFGDAFESIQLAREGVKFNVPAG